MATGRGWAVVLLLAVTGLTGCAGGGKRSEDSVILVNGCRFEPRVRGALIMECDYAGTSYTGVRSMNLIVGSFSSAVAVSQESIPFVLPLCLDALFTTFFWI